MSMYIPQTLADGRYSVGDLIGHGGMAEVHIGTDTRLGRTVAIKIMRSDLAGDQTFLRRFHREALSVAKLNNPNIVAIYDSGDEEFADENGGTVRVPYIVMEYIKGQTLRDILKVNGALSEHDTAQVMIGVLSALAYSHREGIIHRDIKPGNIMISDQGIVKVMDFGIARALDDSQTTMTQSQGVVGTAQYLSPEQAQGKPVDSRSDLYSAGCVLYEMLTGRPPFVGESAVAIAYQHVSENAVPPSTLVPGLPKVWDDVVAKAMAKNRANRYATAGEFRDDIVRVMNGQQPLASSSMAPKAAAKSEEDLKDTPVVYTPPVSVPPSPYGNPPYGNPPVQGRGYPQGNPQTEFTGVLTDGEEERRKAEEDRRIATRNRNIAIAIIAVVVVAVIAVIVVLAATGGGNGGDTPASTQVTVPTITSDMSSDRAKERIESVGLVYQYKEDTDSTEPAGTFTRQDPEGGTSVDPGTTVTCWFSAGPSSTKIPDVANLTQSEAQTRLKSSGFTVGSIYTEDSATVSKDSVTRTDPASGQSAKKGSSVDLYISNGMTTVPEDLEGMTQQNAQETLSKLNFQVVVEQEHSDSVASGQVTRTSPAGGEHVEQGSQVTIYVSEGQRTVQLISLVGMTYENASATLESQGLVAARTGSTASDAVVASMSVNGKEVQAGDQVAVGETVTLTMSGGTVEPTEQPTDPVESPSTSSGDETGTE